MNDLNEITRIFQSCGLEIRETPEEKIQIIIDEENQIVLEVSK